MINLFTFKLLPIIILSRNEYSMIFIIYTFLNLYFQSKFQFNIK